MFGYRYFVCCCGCKLLIKIDDIVYVDVDQL